MISDCQMKQVKIVLIDYHKGNIKSVERGLESAGSDVMVSDDPSVIAAAKALVLPGVGAFADAASALSDAAISEVVKERIAAGMPFLGICLGLHLLFEGGMEHSSGDKPTPGLGIIPGIVTKMPKKNAAGNSFKIPHVGWNSIDLADDSPLFDGITSGEFFYFTHSYAAPESEFTLARTEHSIVFPAAVQKGNAYGVQFHPEKSSAAGARVLKNFVSIVESEAY